MKHFKLSLTQTKIKKRLLILLLLPLTMACKKDSPTSYCAENPDDCVDVRKVKDYFYFKLGSWWVYEEENTGLRDSMYVLETYSDPSSVIFSTELFSTYDGYEYRFWTTGVWPNVKNNIAKKSEKSTRVVRNKGKSGDYVAEATCFLFYPTSGLSTISYGGVEHGYDNILKIENVHDDYTILDNSFHNVVIVSEEHTAIEETQPTVHYFSPNVGLLKKELLDSNQIWNLVDYHIEN